MTLLPLCLVARYLCVNHVGTKWFKGQLDEYKAEFRKDLRKHLERESQRELSEQYMNYVDLHHVQGWSGCLYNFHNNIVRVIAPYMDNQFRCCCLNVGDRFRRGASGITRAILEFHAPFERLPFLGNLPCAEVKGWNRVRTMFADEVGALIRKTLSRQGHVRDYDHRRWLGALFEDADFRGSIETDSISFDRIVTHQRFESLLQCGLEGTLSRGEYHLLWKLLRFK